MVGVMAAPGGFLELVEVCGKNELPGDQVVERGTGEFLVLARYFSRDHRDENDQLVLTYRVLGRLTPEEFYGLLHQRATGPCTADDISDHLVRAFDHGMVQDLGLVSALFAYRAPDGRMVHQHST